MTQDGPVQGDAAKGFDKPYARNEAAGRKELNATRTDKHVQDVKRDDTAMKNPDGDLYNPSAKP